MAAAPRQRTSSLAMILGGIFLVVSLSGLVSLGPSLDSGEHEGTGYVEPTGKAVGTVPVEALASVKFNSTEYTAPVGIVEFDYTGATGHTLAFKEPEFNGFLLTTDAAGPKRGKVDLAAGEYTIYCTVPGHEAQGMIAAVTVAE
jgi:plastocyanin